MTPVAAALRERQKSRPAGVPLLSHGFRPFFLAAALWAAGSLALWLWSYGGGPLMPSHFPALTWHVHEMLYGFVVAAVAGFLLTAIPNWTGRLPLQGTPLLLLVLLWLAGRLAVTFSAVLGAGAAAALDLAFPAVLLAVVLREILAGRNWRNLPMAGAVLILGMGNALMHAEAAGLLDHLVPGLGWRLGLAVVVMLVSLIGGRIIPSFTRNWLARRAPGPLPAPFGTIDRLALACTAVALLLWVVAPYGRWAALALLPAAGFQALRLARWCGHRTLAEPLVWVLHLAYAWLPLGLGLLAASGLTALPETLALHALTAGAIGTIILAVMTRATLGHTGRTLQADGATVAIYLAVTLAAIARLAAPLLPEQMLPLLAVSGAAWIAAFLGFALIYGRYLVGPRPSP